MIEERLAVIEEQLSRCVSLLESVQSDIYAKEQEWGKLPPYVSQKRALALLGISRSGILRLEQDGILTSTRGRCKNSPRQYKTSEILRLRKGL